MYPEVFKSQKWSKNPDKQGMSENAARSAQVARMREALNRFGRAVRHWHCISIYAVVSFGWVACEFELMRMEYKYCIPLRDARKETRV